MSERCFLLITASAGKFILEPLLPPREKPPQRYGGVLGRGSQTGAGTSPRSRGVSSGARTPSHGSWLRAGAVSLPSASGALFWAPQRGKGQSWGQAQKTREKDSSLVHQLYPPAPSALFTAGAPAPGLGRCRVCMRSTVLRETGKQKGQLRDTEPGGVRWQTWLRHV